MRVEASPVTVAGWTVDSEENRLRCVDWPESADYSEVYAESGNGGRTMLPYRLLR